MHTDHPNMYGRDVLSIALFSTYDNARTQNKSINQSINQLYLNTVNGSASWFSDMPCDNYNL